MSVLLVASMIARHWKAVLGVPAGLIVVLLLYVLARGPEYVATTTFAPAAPRSSASRLAGLAAQFGFSIGGMPGGESVAFYADLLESREILEATALAQYHVRVGPNGPDTLVGNLPELLRVGSEAPEKRRREVVRKLRDRLTVRTNQDAGLITVEVTAPWPGLAEQVGRRLLGLVNEFNLEKRQSQAAAERAFIEERLRHAQQELEAAESGLERFLELNRRYQDSPRLQFEAARLERRVDLRQQVYTTLAQSYEEARIEEVRDTPVITIVDQPEGSAKPRRSLVALLILGLVLGTALGVALAFAREVLDAERDKSPEAFRDLVAAIERSPLRMIVKWKRREKVPIRG